MRRNLRAVSLILGSFLILQFVYGQSPDRFAYAITDNVKGGVNWSYLRKLDLQTGAYSDVMLNGTDVNRTVYDAVSKSPLTTPLVDTRFGNLANAAFGTGVAAAAFDKRHNRLYFTPMFIDQLRYVDLQTMNVYVINNTALTGSSMKAADQSNIITRMVIDEDGNGYALTNDGEHLVQFSTGKKTSVTDLGGLVDASVNGTVSVHNSCTSYGGDMVADNDGNLYVLSARNHVFKVNIETRVATHLGPITGVPANFTINGAAVDEHGQILVTSAVDASTLYTIDPQTWIATARTSATAPWQTADLANSNVLQTRKPVNAPELIAATPRMASPIQLYPNPVTTNMFNLVFNEAKTGTYTIQVTDASGLLVTQKQFTVGSKGQSVSAITLPGPAAKGIYFVKVNDPNSKTIYSNKIVVQ
jgi:hypothetical protein